MQTQKTQEEIDKAEAEYQASLSNKKDPGAISESGLSQMETTKPIASMKKGEVAGDVTFEKGKIRFHAGYAGKGSEAQLSIAIDSSYFLDKLAAKIPGKLDNAAIEMIKLALSRQ